MTANSCPLCKVILVIIKQIINSHSNFLLVNSLFFLYFSTFHCPVNKMLTSSRLWSLRSSRLGPLQLWLLFLLNCLLRVVSSIFVTVMRVLQFSSVICLLLSSLIFCNFGRLKLGNALDWRLGLCFHKILFVLFR